MQRFPIAIKLILMTIILLACTTGLVAWRTSELVIEESAGQQRDANRAQAQSRGKEIEVTLANIVEKTQVFGTLLLRESVPKNHSLHDTSGKKTFKFQFKRDPEVIAITVFERNKAGFRAIGSIANAKLLKEFGKSPKYLRYMNKKRPFQKSSVFGGKVSIVNRSIPGKVPLISIGVPLVKDDLNKVTHIAVADIKLYSIQKGFETQGVRETYLVDKDGRIMAHPNEIRAIKGESLRKNKIVKTARRSKTTSGDLVYKNNRKKENMVGAFYRTSFGLSVISEAPESVILAPARNVQRNIFYITGMVLSAAIFVIFAFSLSLTRPIEKLVLLAGEVARGNFNILARSQVKSRDEVGELAFAFDNMVVGLKERDKAKNILNKFHGSTIAEDLMQKEASVGGDRKEVAVFFSDIRGFTNFSEKRTPEEVVNMLNEYFGMMVPCIYQSEGVVDKFIGDAIMAIWGAPKSTGDDAHNAVMACINMRRQLEILNAKRKERGESSIMIGMGVHFGSAISGTIGSEDRMEYTVIGDTVNITARIEAATKSLGIDLLISEQVSKHLTDRIISEYAGRVEVQGKDEVLKLYRVLGYYDENNEEIVVKTKYSEYEAGHDAKVKVT